MVLYALRLYADFPGGIDMALGVGELFGVAMPENFDRPYLSKNIEEYWTRWHMTMGSWFRDYVFYPLNVSKTFLKWTKGLRGRFGNGFMSRLPLYTATLVVWLATGVWHGAGWNFALWGLTNGVVIILSLTLKPLYDRFHGRFPGLKGRKAYGAFEIVRTFLLMCLIRLWDCYEDPRAVWRAFTSLFTAFGGAALRGLSALGLGTGDWIVVLAMAALMLFVSLKKGEGSFRAKYLDTPARLWLAAAGLLLVTLLLGAYGPGYAAADFIYGQF
jgi:D-alanyl-lipoteichoic acid acyltransferase DltB (MBOAT superfamily)